MTSTGDHRKLLGWIFERTKLEKLADAFDLPEDALAEVYKLGCEVAVPYLRDIAADPLAVKLMDDAKSASAKPGSKASRRAKCGDGSGERQKKKEAALALGRALVALTRELETAPGCERNLSFSLSFSGHVKDNLESMSRQPRKHFKDSLGSTMHACTRSEHG